MSVAARHARDIARRTERKLRHLSDDLRYALRKAASLPLADDAALSAPWEEWRPKLAQLDLRDWNDMDTLGAPADKIDEARKGAWDRFVRRQIEKNAEKQKEDVEESAWANEGGERKRKGEEADEGERRRAARRRTDEGEGRDRDRRERRSGAASSGADAESARKVS